MSKLLKYKALHGGNVTVHCTDGSTVYGFWSDWISALDNEPDGECIIVDLPNGGGPCEIPADAVDRIEAA